MEYIAQVRGTRTFYKDDASRDKMHPFGKLKCMMSRQTH